MATTRKNAKNKTNNVLRLRSVAELPEHKVAVELDELDHALIEAQQEDPFFSFGEVAKTWGVTSATIRNRIRRLKTNGVIDVITVINPYKVGFETFAQVGIKMNAEADPSQLVKALQGIEGVSGIMMVTGSFDIFVTYVGRNMERYRQFVMEELRKVPGIASFESFMGLDIYERWFLVGVVRRRE